MEAAITKNLKITEAFPIDNLLWLKLKNLFNEFIYASTSKLKLQVGWQ